MNEFDPEHGIKLATCPVLVPNIQIEVSGEDVKVQGF